MGLLTVKEAAERLRVSRTCVYALVQCGEIPCVRIGVGRGTIRIDAGDLAAFVENAKSACANLERDGASIPCAFEQLDSEKLTRAWNVSSNV